MAIMRSLTLDELVQQDVPYEGTFAVMWAEVELATVMIAACIPVMRKMIVDEVSTRARGSVSRGSPSKDPSSRPRSGQIRAFLRHDRHSVAVPITAPRRTRVSNIHPLMRLSVAGIRSGSMGSLSLSYNGATSRMSVGTFSRWYSVDAHDEHELWRSRATTRHDTEEQQPDQRDLSPSNDEILGEEDRSDRTTMPKHIYFQMQPLR